MSTLEVLVRDFLAHLTIEKGSSPHTVAAYRRDLARYVTFLTSTGTESLANVTESDVADFLAAVRSGDVGGHPLAASAAGRTIIAVRSLHRFAHREGAIPSDVAAAVRPPNTRDAQPHALSIDDVGALLASVTGEEPAAMRDRALLEVLYGTGARISEAVGLALDDIDAEERTVRLFGKGSKTRLVPLGSYALDALAAYIVRGRPSLAAKGTGSPHVFLNSLGRPLSRQSAWGIIRGAAERAGLAGAEISPHTLRHSYATHLLAGGADVRVVHELLGHASVTTTQIYTHITIESLRETYALAHPRAR